MAEYTFKCETWSWIQVLGGIKTFEVRMHDPERPVKVGDTIYLRESFYGAETGRELRATVVSVFPLSFLDRFYKPPCARHYYMQDCPLEVWGLFNVEAGE